MKKQKLLKYVIRACKGYYDIAELTIIDGYDIIFSGAIEKFEVQCDVSMIVYRDELLKREVMAKNIFGATDTKLFVFLKSESDLLDIVEKAHTADVQEVRYGKPVQMLNDVISEKTITVCSCCNGKISKKDTWCKHCGAKMNKECENNG